MSLQKWLEHGWLRPKMGDPDDMTVNEGPDK
jgi:hypothetical protein